MSFLFRRAAVGSKAHQLRNALLNSTTVSGETASAKGSDLLLRSFSKQVGGSNFVSGRAFGSDGGWRSVWYLGGCCALGLVGGVCGLERIRGEAESKEGKRHAERVREFRNWLRDRGADVEAVEIRPSKEGSNSGLGLYTNEFVICHARRGIGSRILDWVLFQSPSFHVASFPLSLAITPERASEDTLLGPHIQELEHKYDIDGPLVMILFIMFQKLLGADSDWKEWLNVVPEEFDTPIHFGEEQLGELKGTPLHMAAQIQKEMLKSRWELLEPACTEICKKVGIKNGPKFSDFAWASSMFWSRVMALPNLATEVECILPGLDFCNHAFNSNARWKPPRKAKKHEIAASESQPPATKRIDVVVDAKRPKPGTELLISYGDKSNEMLLFSHGFTVDVNPHDSLMINCPLVEPSGDEETMKARLQLLTLQGLRPQFFLPGGEALKSAGQVALKWEKQTDMGRNVRVNDKGLKWIFPEEVWQILEAFVIEQNEVGAKLEALNLELQTGKRAVGKKNGKLEEMGLQMAKATTLVRLLEMRMVELEGPDGTGTLDEDIKLIEDTGPENMPSWKWSCIVYRAGQKWLTREWLSHARLHMQEVMSKLQLLYEAHSKKQQKT